MSLQERERRRQQRERDREAERNRRKLKLHDEARLRPDDKAVTHELPGPPAEKPTAISARGPPDLRLVRLSTGAVAARYGVTTRSVDRWWKNPDLNFPQPIIINERKYWAVTDLETWERGRVAENTRRPQKTERVGIETQREGDAV